MGTDTFADGQITWSIPMFHLNAHCERCRSFFSPYLLLYHARMDGEGVERRWSMLNGYAPATREMGPGSRRDILDAVFADQNWVKVTKLGRPFRVCQNVPVTDHLPASTLLRRIKVAVVERGNHVTALEEFTKSLPAASIEKWTDMVVAWEASPATAPNPYEFRRAREYWPLYLCSKLTVL